MLRLLIIPILFMIHMSVYDFKVQQHLDGEQLTSTAYKGKKILIVNTASKCGFTPQYADLEKLYDKYKDKLVIIGFPANDFGSQEPGILSEELWSYIPNGRQSGHHRRTTAPLFKYLTEEAIKLGTPAPVIKMEFYEIPDRRKW